MGFFFLQRVKIVANYAYTTLWEQRKFQGEIFDVIKIIAAE
jgi:hypothetical protein